MMFLIQPWVLGLLTTIKASYMQNVMHLTVSAFDREANSKACTPGIWKDYNIKLAITNFEGALDKLTRSGCEMVLRGWSPEAGNNFK